MPRQKQATENEPNFEQCLERIQVVVELLENGHLQLEESLQLFAEGVELVRRCQEHLAQAEHKVELLVPGAGEKFSKKPFSLAEEERP